MVTTAKLRMEVLIVTFSEKIRTLRTGMDLTQKEVAEACGVTLRTYVGYELDGRRPKKSIVYEKLGELFECDPLFLERDDDKDFISVSESKIGNNDYKQAQYLVNEVSSLFAGGKLSEEDKDKVMFALQKVYIESKQQAMEKEEQPAV